MFRSTEGFDGSAATTRSLLGYGVLAGLVYLIVGTILGLTTEGFEFSRHPLSVLMLGDWGWVQRANLMVTGGMVGLAALGMARAAGGDRNLRRAGFGVMAYGVCLFASGVFAPDPVNGFPSGASGGSMSAVGLLHLVFGAVGFICVIAAAVSIGRWHRQQARRRAGRVSLVVAVVVFIGFGAGAAFSTTTAGVASIWIAVVTTWLWLAATSVDLYRRIPHPVLSRRV
jgi:hypothetical protein